MVNQLVDTPTDKPADVDVCNCQGEPSTAFNTIGVDLGGKDYSVVRGVDADGRPKIFVNPTPEQLDAMQKAVNDMLIYGVGIVHVSPKDVVKPYLGRLFQALHDCGLDPYVYLSPSARHEYDYWLAARPNPVG